MAATHFFGAEFFGGEFFSSATPDTADTHDGGWWRRRRRRPDTQDERDREFRAARERLHEMVVAAYNEQYGATPIAAEIRDAVAPYGGVSVDWDEVAKFALAQERLMALAEARETQLMDDLTVIGLLDG